MDEILNLIESAKLGDDASFGVLLNKYESLLLSLSKKYSDMCPEPLREDEDFLQEAKIAFFRAIQTYNVEKNITFGAYAKTCIRNKLISCIRTMTSKKRKKSLKNEDKSSYRDVAQESVVFKEQKEIIYSLAQNNLSQYERKIFGMYLSGCRAKEISKKIGKDEKSVNNAIYRIKSKLSRLAESDT